MPVTLSNDEFLMLVYHRGSLNDFRSSCFLIEPTECSCSSSSNWICSSSRRTTWQLLLSAASICTDETASGYLVKARSSIDRLLPSLNLVGDFMAWNKNSSSAAPMTFIEKPLKTEHEPVCQLMCRALKPPRIKWNALADSCWFHCGCKISAFLYFCTDFLTIRGQAYLHAIRL